MKHGLFGRRKQNSRRSGRAFGKVDAFVKERLELIVLNDFGLFRLFHKISIYIIFPDIFILRIRFQSLHVGLTGTLENL